MKQTTATVTCDGEACDRPKGMDVIQFTSVVDEARVRALRDCADWLCTDTGDYCPKCKEAHQ